MTAPTVADLVAWFERFAPRELAEDWDNVGLLIGETDRPVERILTCLTLTPDVADEAIARDASLIATHHPILFRPVQRLTSDTAEGAMLLRLIAANVAVFSPHTSFDGAANGINRQLAELFDLQSIEVLRPISENAAVVESVGAGRWGRLPQLTTVRELCERVKRGLQVDALQFVGEPDAIVSKLGIACGAAAEFLHDAHDRGCEALLTGEARFHTCLEARSLGIALLLPGHYATERPAIERLSEILATEFPTIDVWASESERDPLRWG